MSRFVPLLPIWKIMCLFPDQDGRLRYRCAKLPLKLEYVNTKWNNSLTASRMLRMSQQIRFLGKVDRTTLTHKPEIQEKAKRRLFIRNMNSASWQNLGKTAGSESLGRESRKGCGIILWIIHFETVHIKVKSTDFQFKHICIHQESESSGICLPN